MPDRSHRSLAIALALMAMTAAKPAAADVTHISWSGPGWYVNDDWGKSAGRPNTDGLLPVLVAGPFANQPDCEGNRPQWSATGNYYNVICAYFADDPAKDANQETRAWDQMMNGH